MAKCKYDFSKDELERLYEEHGSFRLAGRALGVSKVTFRQQYLVTQGKCMSCASELPDSHGHRLCTECLKKNQVEDKPESKQCEYCPVIITREKGQSKLSWSKKKGCQECLDKLYNESYKRTKNRYRARYNEAIRNNPKTKEYQATYRKSETGRAKRQASSAKRRASKVTTASMTVNSYIEKLLLIPDHQCPYCPTKGRLSIDHIQPLSRGGTHTEDNIELICLDCNRRKGNKTKQEYIEYLTMIKE